jgi:hypothetical protein
MADAIVPPNRNSGPSTLEFDVADDFTALVRELMAEQHLAACEAQGHALELIDELHAYAVVWDTDAGLAGNPVGLAAPRSAAATQAPPVRIPQHLVLLE